MKLNKLSLAVGLSIYGALPVSMVHAQQDGINADNKSGINEEELVVIGTATSVARSAFDSPVNAVAIDEESIARLSASSNADLLRNVPGVAVEGGGGEVAVNLRVIGLPTAGQYSFTPLNFDGFTSFSYFGLNTSSFDVYQRPDLGVERVEFVRGGVSNLFGPGSVAGVLNYISKTGSDEPEGKVQLEMAQDGRLATNFAASGKVGGDDSKDYFALSGYYRYDEGPVDTGINSDGYQIKGNFKHEFEDGSGEFKIFAQAIDDRVAFFLPLPLDAESQEFAQGNNGQDVETIQTGALSNLVYPTANGSRELSVANGVSTSGGSLGLEYDKEYDSGWRVDIKGKYSKYDHTFNFFAPAGGDNVRTQDNFLAWAGLDGYDASSFNYVDTGEELAATDLIYRSQVWERVRPARDFTGEFNLIKDLEINSVTHTFTVGSFFSRAVADDFNHRIFYTSEFNDKPRLVNVSVSGDNAATTDVETGTQHYSVNGYAGSSSHVNNGGSVNRTALYFADQIEGDRWNFDVGVRIEDFDGEYFTEGSRSAPVDPGLYNIAADDGVLANLANDNIGDGRVRNIEFDDTAWAASVSGLYRLTDSMNVFGNLSRGFFWPQLRGYPGLLGDTTPTSVVGDSFAEEIITQGTLGLKFATGNFDGSISGFYVQLDDRQNIDVIEQANGDFITVTEEVSSKAKAIEAIGNYSLGDYVTLNANLTWNDGEYSSGPNDGKEIERIPDLLAGAGIVFDNDVFNLGVDYSYRSKNWANSSNTVELDALNLIRLSAGYALELSDEEELHFGLSVFNATDERGLTEGNPRAGGTASGDFAVGRPILPRRVTLKVTYSF